MIAMVMSAFAFVLVFEGLVFALAPSRLEDLLETLRTIPVEARRVLGLAAVAAGVALLWAVRSAGVG